MPRPFQISVLTTSRLIPSGKARRGPGMKCGVTRRDNIRSERIRGPTRMVQASEEISLEEYFTSDRSGSGEHRLHQRIYITREPQLISFHA